MGFYIFSYFGDDMQSTEEKITFSLNVKSDHVKWGKSRGREKGT